MCDIMSQCPCNIIRGCSEKFRDFLASRCWARRNGSHRKIKVEQVTKQ